MSGGTRFFRLANQISSRQLNAVIANQNGILRRHVDQIIFHVNIEQVWVRVEKVVALYNGQRPA